MDYAAYTQAILQMAGLAIQQGERDKASRLLQQARERFEGILPPELEQLEQQLGPSAFESVTPDAQADTAQRDALRRAMEMAAEGFGAEDEAALTEISNRSNAAARSQREGIAASMAQRGGIGSGADYALQAEAADNAAMRANEGQKRVQAEMLRRRAQGVQTAGAMASSLRGQTSSEAARKAEARDRIAAQNAAFRRNAAQQRFDNARQRARDIAGATSEQTAQGISNANFTSGALGAAGSFAHGASHQPEPYREQPDSYKPSPPPMVQADPYGPSSPDDWEQWNPVWNARFQSYPGSK